MSETGALACRKLELHVGLWSVGMSETGALACRKLELWHVGLWSIGMSETGASVCRFSVESESVS